MGLTIHYSFDLGDGDHVLALGNVQNLRRRALDLPFERVDQIQHFVGAKCIPDRDRLRWFGHVNADDDSDHPLARPEEIIAFSTMPGKGCESAEFGFRRAGGEYSWQAFCKTEYMAGDGLSFLRCHLSIIAMLDHAQELGLLRWVDDESGYWERRDWVDLLLRYRGCEMKPEELLAVSDQLFDWFGPVREKAAFVLEED